MYSNRIMLAETLNVIAETRSFSRAGERLGLSQSTISRRMAALEERLGGMALFHRQTRKLELTDAAKRYLISFRDLLVQFDSLETSLLSSDQRVSGKLRISLPPALGRSRLLVPLARLGVEHPDLRLWFELSESYVDFRDRVVDLAVRLRPLEQSGISQVVLGQCRFHFVASPEYLALQGAPQKMADLQGHSIIGLGTYDNSNSFAASNGGLAALADIEATFVANDVAALFELVLSGLGITLLPDYLVTTALLEGRLVEVLHGYAPSPMTVYGLFPHALRDSVTIKLALACLEQSLD
jgi:DNA-binding transcriptional LysR family regulator